jgi:hypothetical protein
MAGDCCPSCTRVVTDRPNYEHGMEPMICYESTVLPDLCIRCASATDRFERLRIPQSQSGRPAPADDVAVGGWIGRYGRVVKLLLGFQKRLSGGSELRFSIPYCATCQAAKPFGVLQAKPQAGFVRILVHRRFRENL